MTQEQFYKRYQYSVREDKIGGGTFGTVYKAYDTLLDRTVAIKVSEVKIANKKEFSLMEEFNAIRALPAHQNIANYEEVFRFENQQGIVDYAIIQYYPDGNLQNLIAKKSFKYEEKEDILEQLLEGIAFLHQHKVLHRDLKPANILVHKRQMLGESKYIIKIADFGLSKVARPDDKSQIANSFGGGTLAYSSPEQLNGQELRFNTDLWAYGAIAYEVLTCKTMFTSKSGNSSMLSENEIIQSILNKDISSDLDILPPKWKTIIAQCLIKDPVKRLRSIEQVYDWMQMPEETIVLNSSEIQNPRTSAQSKKEFKLWIAAIVLFILGLGAYKIIKNPKQEISNLQAVKESLVKKYDEVGTFSEGMAWVKMSDEYGYVDSTGKEVVPLIYIGGYSYDRNRFSNDYHEGMVAVQEKEGKIGYIDKTGKMIIPFIYDSACAFSNGLATVERNGKYGSIDKTGKEIIPFIYDYIGYFSNGLASVRLNGKYGFVEKTGKVVVPLTYDEAFTFSDGLALVSLGRRPRRHFLDSLGLKLDYSKYGFIDKTGKEVVPLIYDEASGFSEGLAAVQFGEKSGFIDKTGKESIPFIYDKASGFSEGLAAVKLNDKYGFIDKAGKEVIPVIYDVAFSFRQGEAYVRLNEKGFYINKKGECVSKDCP